MARSKGKKTGARERANDEKSAPRPLTPRRRAAFYSVAILAPFFLLLLAEGVLRVACSSCGLPLFVTAPFGEGRYEIANRGVAARWFAGLESPPTPRPEPFARRKPANGYRVFVLGESSAAGFPYPPTGTFASLIRDALRDVLPRDTVEVINLGIAGVSSFALADVAGEVARRKPDAVLIYTGHNEYYGALGVGSRSQGVGLSTRMARGYMLLLRSRLVLAMRNGIVAVTQAAGSGAPEPEEAASLMEILARGQEFPFGSAGYHAGVAQFESNLESIVRRFRRDGVPVFIGSLASNVRDLEPFISRANSVPGGAADLYRTGQAALATGDSATALRMLTEARDLDVVRFRAPSEFNAVIRRVTARDGVTYVPVAEKFAEASSGGLPGENLFLEHVHPNRQGYALIARAFVEGMAGAGALARADLERLRPWDRYEKQAALTEFDERVAHHTIRALEARWPFVPAGSEWDYRAGYRPADLLDSLALAVASGAPWEQMKAHLATEYERQGAYELAAGEYAGLARANPLFDEPLLLQGRALLSANRPGEAEQVLRRALAIRAAPQTLAVLGRLAAQRQDIPEAIALYARSLQLDGWQPVVLYELSLTYALAQDLAAARNTAIRLAQIAPDYPGLAEWLRTLGVS